MSDLLTPILSKSPQDLIDMTERAEAGATTATEAAGVATAQAVIATDQAGIATDAADNASASSGAAALAEAAALNYRNQARDARDEASAIVYGGDFSVDPAPGSVPISLPDGSLDPRWMPGALEARSISLTATTVSEAVYGNGTIRAIEVFDDRVWGASPEGALHYTTDGGESWVEVVTVPAGMTVVGMIPTEDGEMLIQSTSRIYKSVGWPDVTDWTLVFENPTTSDIRRWSFDGTGRKFIVTHYNADDRQHSYGGWISTDNGDTWALKYDSRARLADPDVSHIHGVCYDPVEDRFWLIEAHGPERGLFWSTDDGDTWVKLGGELQPDPLPTTITWTDKGLVLAMDSSDPNGICVIRRQTDPANMHLSLAYQWRQLSGFGNVAKRDPRTGLVYIGWRSGDMPREASDWSPTENSGSRPPWIGVSDGNTATLLYEYEGRDWQRGDSFRDVIPDSINGRLLGRITLQGSNTNFAAALGERGAAPATGPDNSAGVFGGRAGHPESISIGVGSIVPSARKTLAIGPCAYVPGSNATSAVVAIGFGAEVSAEGSTSNTVVVGALAKAHGFSNTVLGARAVANVSDGVIIGYTASGDRWAVAVGMGATAAERAVAIGSGTTPTTAEGSAVGIGRDVIAAASSVTIGRAAVTGKGGTEGRQGVAIGHGAETEGARYAVAIGHMAHVGVPRGVAIGDGARSAHTDSIAIGQGSETTAQAQYQIGARHIEMAAVSQPAAPAAGAGRLYLEDDGEGGQRLCVRFASGSPVVIATQP